jgi:hypothetical protein
VDEITGSIQRNPLVINKTTLGENGQKRGLQNDPEIPTAGNVKTPMNPLFPPGEQGRPRKALKPKKRPERGSPTGNLQKAQ